MTQGAGQQEKDREDSDKKKGQRHSKGGGREQGRDGERSSRDGGTGRKREWKQDRERKIRTGSRLEKGKKHLGWAA